METKKLRVPLYPTIITLIKAADYKEVNEKYNTEALPGYDAFCFEVDQEGHHVLMVFSEPVKPHVIAHECVHAVNMIFDNCGIQLDLVNDEPQAYLLSWLFKKCEKFLKE